MPLSDLYNFVINTVPRQHQVREPLVFALDEHINRKRQLDGSCIQAMRFFGLTEEQTNSVYNLAREELFGS